MTKQTRPVLLVGVLVVLAVMFFAISLVVGRAPLNVAEAVSSVLAGEVNVGSLVLLELRVPRAILGFIVGASLGLSGAAMQGMLRNPLAEPGIVGVSGCAALGAVIAFYSGLSAIFPLALPMGGIAGAFIAVLLLYVMAGNRASTLTLILAGVAINAFAGALTALALNLSSNPYAVFEIVFWQMGSLADRSLDHVTLSLPLMLVGWGLLLASARGLEALTLGEETAASLGINLATTRGLVVVGTAFAVGGSVAVSGVIGFVGLVVPHLLRPFVGHHPGKLLYLSMLGGGVLVLAADVVVRLIPTGAELKLGVLTATIGAPFFLWLVHRMRREIT